MNRARHLRSISANGYHRGYRVNRAILCCNLAVIGLAGCGMTIGQVMEHPETSVFRPPEDSPIVVDPTTMIFYCPQCGECTPQFVEYKCFTKRYPECSNVGTAVYRCQRTSELFGVGNRKCAEIIWVGYWNTDWIRVQTEMIHAQAVSQR
jgi:hypothetical protein